MIYFYSKPIDIRNLKMNKSNEKVFYNNDLMRIIISFTENKYKKKHKEKNQEILKCIKHMRNLTKMIWDSSIRTNTNFAFNSEDDVWQMLIYMRMTRFLPLLLTVYNYDHLNQARLLNGR